MELLEPVTAMLAVYLTPKGGQPVFLTTPMMDILLHSPVLAQNTNRCSVAELRNSVQKDAFKVCMPLHNSASTHSCIRREWRLNTVEVLN